MKRRILAIALCVSMLLGAAAVSASAFGLKLPQWIAKSEDNPAPVIYKEYGLWVNGVQVTSENAGNIPLSGGAKEENGAGTEPGAGKSSGKASYDAKTHTLTLDNVTIFADGTDAIKSQLGKFEPDNPTLTIRVIGTTTLEAVDYKDDHWINVWIGYVFGATIEETMDNFKYSIRSDDPTEIVMGNGASLVTIGTSFFNCESVSVKGGSWTALSPDDSNIPGPMITNTFYAEDTSVYAYTHDSNYFSSAFWCEGSLVLKNSVVYATSKTLWGWPKSEETYSAMHVEGGIKGDPYKMLGSVDLVPFTEKNSKRGDSPVLTSIEYDGKDFNSEGEMLKTVCIESDSCCCGAEKVQPKPYDVVSLTTDSYYFETVTHESGGGILTEEVLRESRETVLCQLIPADQGGWYLRVLNTKNGGKYLALGNNGKYPVTDIKENPYEEYNDVICFSEKPYRWEYKNGAFCTTTYKYREVTDYLFLSDNKEDAQAKAQEIFNAFWSVHALWEHLGSFLQKIIPEPTFPYINPIPFPIVNGTAILGDYPSDDPRIVYGLVRGTHMENVGTTYYLRVPVEGQEDVFADTRYTPSILTKAVRNPKHDSRAVASALTEDGRKSFHTLVCRACGKTTTELCRYGFDHRCVVCGCFDPAFTAIKGVQVITSNLFLSSNVRITVNASVALMAAKKIEYTEFDPTFAANGEELGRDFDWQLGCVNRNSFSFVLSKAPAGMLFRITDASGRQWIYLWVKENGPDAELKEVLLPGADH